jgi:hypothetical protein
MAFYVSNQTGNWSAAATWGKGSNTPTIHASTNITPTTGGVYSAVFTAPNITGNQSVGTLVYCVTKAGTGDWTATLQEDTGGGFADVPGATATITNASLLANNFLYFKWETPYTYAVATADKYRIKLTVSVASSGTCAANSGGSNFMFLEVSDIGGPPVLNDRAWIVTPNQDTPIAITVDGTSGAVGDAGTASTVLPIQRSITEAIHIDGYTASSGNALLKWDTTASATLTVKGNIVISGGGELQMGTVITPYPSAYVATLIFNQNSVNGTSGGAMFNGGRTILQGSPKPDATYWKKTYVSGTGTAADPLIVSNGTAWEVNDEIVITNSTYNTIEYKFIKTVNSSTSYILSDTKGGAESALAYSHTTNDEILNIERNVIITGTNLTLGAYWINNSLTSGDLDIDWIRTEAMGSSTSNKSGFYIGLSGLMAGSCDYSVAYTPLHRSFVFASAQSATHTGLIAVKPASTLTSTVGAISVSGANKTFVDCYAIATQRVGFELYTWNHSFIRCKAIGCNQSGNGTSGGWYIPSNGPIVYSRFISCEAHANRSIGLYIRNSMISCTWTDCQFGTEGTNTVDMQIDPNLYCDVIFETSTLSSATLISGINSASSGTKLTFIDCNIAGGSHIFRTYYLDGYFDKDSSVFKNSSSSLRLDTIFSGTSSHAFTILAKNGETITIKGNMRYDPEYDNADYTLPSVTISGLGITPVVANATVAALDVWEPFELEVTQNSGSDGLLTVTFSGQSATPTGSAYFDGLVCPPFVTRSRFYGYLFDETLPTRIVNSFVTANEATALAYTGISIDFENEIVTVSENHTLEELYDYCQARLSAAANLLESVFISTADGITFILSFDLTIDGCALSGSGKRINLGSNIFVLANGGSTSALVTDVSGTLVPIVLQNVIVGSRCRVEKQSDGSAILSTEAADTEVSASFQHTVDTPVNIIVRKGSGATKYQPYFSTGTITNTGLTVTINQVEDTIIA